VYPKQSIGVNQGVIELRLSVAEKGKSEYAITYEISSKARYILSL